MDWDEGEGCVAVSAPGHEQAKSHLTKSVGAKVSLRKKDLKFMINSNF